MERDTSQRVDIIFYPSVANWQTLTPSFRSVVELLLGTVQKMQIAQLYPDTVYFVKLENGEAVVVDGENFCMDLEMTTAASQRPSDSWGLK